MTSYFRVKNSIVHEKFDDETVIVNLDSGCYYNLHSMGDTIWAWAAAGYSQSQIVTLVGQCYEGDAAEMAASVASFLESLVSEALLARTDDGAAPALPDNMELRGVFIPPTFHKYTDMEELLQLDPIHEVDKLGWPSAKPPTA